MATPFSADEPHRLWAELQRLVAERAPAEIAIPARQEEEEKEASRGYVETRDAIARRHEEQDEAVQTAYAAQRREIVGQYQPELATLQRAYEDTCADVEKAFQDGEKEAQRKLQEARWEATSVYEVSKNAPYGRLKQIQDQVAARRMELQRSADYAASLVQKRHMGRDWPAAGAAARPANVDPGAWFQETSEKVFAHTRDLHQQQLPAWFEGGRLTLPAAGIVSLAVIAWGVLVGWSIWGVAATMLAGLLASGGLFVWMYRAARRRTAAVYDPLRQAWADADQAALCVLDAAQVAADAEARAIRERFETAVRRADQTFSTTLAELHRRRADLLKQAELKYPPAIAERTIAREQELERLEHEYETCRRSLDARLEAEMAALNQRHAHAEAERRQRFGREWDAMAQKWLGGMARFQADLASLTRACGELFPPWQTTAWDTWRPPADAPAAIPFGRWNVSLESLEGGVPRDARLAVEPAAWQMPALTPFPDRPLLFRATGEGRARATEAIQAVMLRMLTTLPPGKVRFMIVDPVGLGENFSAFMHLADFDDQLISSRIWTESQHIDRRLADLTEHMENILQIYLRNEFETIRQYNEMAGEMAEPYRVLVVANFPVNFSEEAARRLMSIVSSGARCGVYTILSVDPTLKMPHGFKLADLEAESLCLRWRDGNFAWDDSPFAAQPLEAAAPPPPEQFTELVRIVGERVTQAGRVEVPFTCVTPDDHAWWQADAGRGIEIPLGRAGAMKLQQLSLGRGTSQHVLVAGKTGSGKSNFLHAVILNTALWYGPDEVELYLVDFKKGVEFKDYAQHELPHVRVVAIESEREFGLSVLQRLDDELRRRGDLFREVGVSDLPNFRQKRPDQTMPRVLLLIDEFQELFVEDDRIGQEAALLLDRLVRQGRAFGMHVLLGSQTLAGAYSLPRATMGQMAVRIALQCSESDAHLILSESNTAARLLTRPGEAIYNDANGLYEGNHPFQIVWLPEQQRGEYLARLAEFARQRRTLGPRPVVFEGNAAADPAANPLLAEWLNRATWSPVAAPQAWLGAAVAIKEPTCVGFARQGGANLALVGQRDESAAGILASAVVGLAAQVAPCDSPTFTILDGARADTPEAGLWERLLPALPHAARLVGPRQANDAVAELAAELARRRDADEEDSPPRFLVIYNLARFRDLRRDDDNFGFGRMGEDQPAKPGQQLADILRDGPPLGIHTLVWCDTYNNLTRALDRASMRELEMRVVFQMNSADSSNLIDTAEATKLGTHRALFYDEGLGQVEKLRPYGIPSAAWLDAVGQRLRAKTLAPGTAPLREKA